MAQVSEPVDASAGATASEDLDARDQLLAVLLRQLAALGRYEKRAFGRRNRAIRNLTKIEKHQR
jgi:hypothetical protein